MNIYLHFSSFEQNIRPTASCYIEVNSLLDSSTTEYYGQPPVLLGILAKSI